MSGNGFTRFIALSEEYACNGQLSHYNIIDPETGEEIVTDVMETVTSQGDIIDRHQQQEDEINVALGSLGIRTHQDRLLAISGIRHTLREAKKSLSARYIVTNWLVAGFVGFIIGGIFL